MENSDSTTAWWWWSSWYFCRDSPSTTEEEEELEEGGPAPKARVLQPSHHPTIYRGKVRGAGPLDPFGWEGRWLGGGNLPPKQGGGAPLP